MCVWCEAVSLAPWIFRWGDAIILELGGLAGAGCSVGVVPLGLAALCWMGGWRRRAATGTDGGGNGTWVSYLRVTGRRCLQWFAGANWLFQGFPAAYWEMTPA